MEKKKSSKKGGGKRAMAIQMNQFDKGKPILPPIAKPVANTIINPVPDEEKEKIRNAEVGKKLNKFKMLFNIGRRKSSLQKNRVPSRKASSEDVDITKPDASKKLESSKLKKSIGEKVPAAPESSLGMKPSGVTVTMSRPEAKPFAIPSQTAAANIMQKYGDARATGAFANVVSRALAAGNMPAAAPSTTTNPSKTIKLTGSSNAPARSTKLESVPSENESVAAVPATQKSVYVTSFQSIQKGTLGGNRQEGPTAPMSLLPRADVSTKKDESVGLKPFMQEPEKKDSKVTAEWLLEKSKHQYEEEKKKFKDSLSKQNEPPPLPAATDPSKSSTMKNPQFYFQDPQKIAAERIKQRIQQRLDQMK